MMAAPPVVAARARRLSEPMPTTPTVEDDDRRGETRVPVRLELRYGDDEEAFADRYASNISYNGLFVITRELHAPGTEVSFALRTADGQIALEGLGLVRWVRKDGQPGGPSGVGLQFTALDEENQRRVRSLVDRYLAAKLAGVEPALPRFDRLSLAPRDTSNLPWAEPDSPALTPPPAAATARLVEPAGPSTRGLWLLAAAGLVALAGLVAVLAR